MTNEADDDRHERDYSVDSLFGGSPPPTEKTASANPLKNGCRISPGHIGTSPSPGSVASDDSLGAAIERELQLDDEDFAKFVDAPTPGLFVQSDEDMDEYDDNGIFRDMDGILNGDLSPFSEDTPKPPRATPSAGKPVLHKASRVDAPVPIRGQMPGAKRLHGLASASSGMSTPRRGPFDQDFSDESDLEHQPAPKLPRPQPPKLQPPKLQPPKSQPPRSQPPKPQPPKSQPLKSQPPKSQPVLAVSKLQPPAPVQRKVNLHRLRQIIANKAQNGSADAPIQTKATSDGTSSKEPSTTKAVSEYNISPAPATTTPQPPRKIVEKVHPDKLADHERLSSSHSKVRSHIQGHEPLSSQKLVKVREADPKYGTDTKLTKSKSTTASFSSALAPAKSGTAIPEIKSQASDVYVSPRKTQSAITPTEFMARKNAEVKDLKPYVAANLSQRPALHKTPNSDLQSQNHSGIQAAKKQVTPEKRGSTGRLNDLLHSIERQNQPSGDRPALTEAAKAKPDSAKSLGDRKREAGSDVNGGYSIKKDVNAYKPTSSTGRQELSAAPITQKAQLNVTQYATPSTKSAQMPFQAGIDTEKALRSDPRAGPKLGDTFGLHSSRSTQALDSVQAPETRPDHSSEKRKASDAVDRAHAVKKVATNESRFNTKTTYKTSQPPKSSSDAYQSIPHVSGEDGRRQVSNPKTAMGNESTESASVPTPSMHQESVLHGQQRLGASRKAAPPAEKQLIHPFPTSVDTIEVEAKSPDTSLAISGALAQYAQSLQTLRYPEPIQDLTPARRKEVDCRDVTEASTGPLGEHTKQSTVSNELVLTKQTTPAEGKAKHPSESSENARASVMGSKVDDHNPTLHSRKSPPAASAPQVASSYFKYTVRQRMYSESDDLDTAVVTQPVKTVFTSVTEANVQVDQLVHSLEQSSILLGLHYQEWHKQRDEHDCVMFETTIIEPTGRKLYYEMWVQRDIVEVPELPKSHNIRRANFGAPFINQTLYILRLCKLITPTDDPADSDYDNDSESIPAPSTSSPILQYISVSAPQFRELGVYSELYTALSHANRTAKDLQVALSHKRGDMSAMAKKWQEDSEKEFAEELARLDKEMLGAGENKDEGDDGELEDGSGAVEDRRGCWKSEFNGLGGEKWRLCVERTKIIGPRNI